MKIAIVSDRVYPYFKGGAEKRYWEIAKHLNCLGHEVHFYTGQWPGMPKQIVVDGITLHGVYQVKKFYVNGHKSIKETLIYTIKLLPQLLMGSYDLIECEQFPLLPIFTAKAISLLRNKPLVVTWHEVWNKELWTRYLGPKGRLGFLIERSVVHMPDHIISVSCHTAQKLIQQYSLNTGNISIIPNGIDLNAICSNRMLGEKSDLIFVGRLLEHKRVDLLLKVVQYAKEYLPNIQCMIIGDGPERSELEKTARQLGVDQNIKFLGFIKDDRIVYSLIKSSRVFVLPSIREGFGIVVVEANACGIPVLVVHHQDNAASELIKEGKNGYICCLDPIELGQKVLQVINDPPQKYFATCREEAQAYSWECIGQNVEQFYKQQMSLAQKSFWSRTIGLLHNHGASQVRAKTQPELGSVHLKETTPGNAQ